MPLPSELPFTSFLQYSPRGVSDLSRQSKAYAHALKNDSAARTLAGMQRIIPYTARRLAEQIPNHGCLLECFGGDVIAIPAPKSAPLVPGGLWPTSLLCQAMRREGIVKDVKALLVRTTAITKSATARAGQRPSPESHFESLTVESGSSPLLSAATRFVIVDDVVTRGATLLGCYARLREAFPDVPISCFAFVRTMSGGEVDSVIAPIRGIISMVHGHLHREP